MYVSNHGLGPWESAGEGGGAGFIGAEEFSAGEGAGFRVVRRKHAGAVAGGEGPVHCVGCRDAVGLFQVFREVEFEDLAGVGVQRAPAGGAFGFGGAGAEALSPVGDARGDATPGNGISVDG